MVYTITIIPETPKEKFLTWSQHGVDVAKALASNYLLARNIPHTLQDHLNLVFQAARAADKMQKKVFEAAISANTAAEEPLAPSIRIINDIDDEITPPLEYHYSNFMWHSDHVPGPDLTSLTGCTCVGSCDPELGLCSCAQKQGDNWVKDTSFIYDVKGKLQEHDYPIFECNSLCSCGDECINRVCEIYLYIKGKSKLCYIGSSIWSQD